MLELNDYPEVRVEMAAGLFPVLYIDNFYADPMGVRDYALSLAFDQFVALYPGRHAPLDDGALKSDTERFASLEARAYVAEMLKSVSTLDIDIDDIRTDFSLITTPARDLLKFQKHPHFDQTPVLSLVYLNPKDMGGTSFWRNRVIDRAAVVTQEDHEAYERFMRNAPAGEVRDEYTMVHTDSWEKIHEIDGKFNRFVAYPASVFHWVECKFVPEPLDLRKSRLTQRFSIHQVNKQAAR
ncbi:MAG: hypothetical protein JWM91_4844 [Rhodospirillales bacterium]|nr:hypothetical protein [Rhodospirillales bacterium]